MKCSTGLLSTSTAALVSAFLVSGSRPAGTAQGSVVCRSGISDGVAEDNPLLQGFPPRPGLSNISEGYSLGCRSGHLDLGFQPSSIDEDEDFTETDSTDQYRLLESDTKLDVISHSESEQIWIRNIFVDLESDTSDDATLAVRSSPPSSPRSPSPPPTVKRQKSPESSPPARSNVARSQEQRSPRQEQATSKHQSENAQASPLLTRFQAGPSAVGYRSGLQQIRQPNADVDEMAVDHLMHQLGVPPGGVGSQARQTLVRAMENNRLRPASPESGSRGRQQTTPSSSPSSSTATDGNQRRSIIANSNVPRLPLRSAKLSKDLSELSIRNEDQGLLSSTTLQDYDEELSEDSTNPDHGLQKRSILLPRTSTMSGQSSNSPLDSIAESDSWHYSGQRSSIGSVSAPVSRAGSPNPARSLPHRSWQQQRQQSVPESPRLDRIQSLPRDYGNAVPNPPRPAGNQRSSTLQFLVDLAQSHRSVRGPQHLQPQPRPGSNARPAARPHMPWRAVPPGAPLTNHNNPFAQYSQAQSGRAHSAELPHPYNAAGRANPTERPHPRLAPIRIAPGHGPGNMQAPRPAAPWQAPRPLQGLPGIPQGMPQGPVRTPSPPSTPQQSRSGRRSGKRDIRKRSILQQSDPNIAPNHSRNQLGKPCLL